MDVLDSRTGIAAVATGRKYRRNRAMVIACQLAGGQSALAEAIGTSQPMIWQLMRGRRPVPLALGLAIEEALGGMVLAADLCPADAEIIREIERRYQARMDREAAANALTLDQAVPS